MSSVARTVLDRAYLRQQVFGDVDLERELLRLFEGQCRRLLPCFAPTLTDPAARREAAHALKSAARAVGAHRVADLSDLLETAIACDAPPAEVDMLSSALVDVIGATVLALSGALAPDA